MKANRSSITHRWRSAVVLFVLLSLSLVALFAILRENPILPRMRYEPKGGLPSGYEWEREPWYCDDAMYSEWEVCPIPGFDTYYGKHPDKDSSGVYLTVHYGAFPRLFMPEDAPLEPGQIGQYTIQWRVLDDEANTSRRFQRAVRFQCRYGVYYTRRCDLWVWAPEQAEMEELLTNLEDLRIRPAASAFEVISSQLGGPGE